MTRYRCVDDRKADGFGVAAACAAAGVSVSAYYAWRSARRAGPTPRHRAEARLAAAIGRIHTASDGTYGAPRVTRDLRDEGWRVNQETVLLVSLWIDPAAESETRVKLNARTAAYRALAEALTGRPEAALHDLVDRRETITHPFYTGA